MNVKEQTFDVFISYYWDTGIPLADHLKMGLKKVGVKAFVDRFDIPDTVKRESDEWRSYIDKAILECKIFVLLMTFGFNTSDEIKRELKFAIDNEIVKLYCKHNELPNNQKIIIIDGKKYDMSKYQYKSFSDKHELLRKVGAVFFGSISKDSESIFLTEAQRIIKSEGMDIRGTGAFLVDIVVGPNKDIIEWLPPNKLNAWLVRSSPYRIIRVTPRTKYYECKTGTGEFFSVRTNGFFHAITPIDFYEDYGIYFISHIINAILDLLIYSIRIMKLRNINKEHAMIIVLRNLSKAIIAYDRYSWCPRFSFASGTSQFIFPLYTFNPKDDWSDISKIFTKVYRDLWTELGNVNITDEKLNKDIYEQLKAMREIYTIYQNPEFREIIIPNIDLKEFRLNNNV